jgi:uncharacterized membrane protein (DUF373 family)
MDDGAIAAGRAAVAASANDARGGQPDGGAEWEARGESAVPHTVVHGLVRRFLEPSQDVLVVVLAVVLLALMVRTLVTVAGHAVAPQVPARVVLGEVLFMLVLVELLRLLVIYLRDHHVSVDVMLEASIVGALREITLLGVTEIPAEQLLVISAFLLTLGLLLRFGDLRIAQRTGPRRPRAAAEVRLPS